MEQVDKINGFKVLMCIHGNSDVAWDGVGNPPGTNNLPSWWYAHNKKTFVSWHRPYVVLTPWGDAAKERRQPYWDWATKQPYINNYGVPEIFTKERIDILDFADNNPPTMENIANPLAKFANPTGVAMGDASMGGFALPGDLWSKAIATSRWGIRARDPAATWADGINNWEKASEAIQGGIGVNSIEDQVYRLFSTNLSSWESFASTLSQTPPTPADFLSLEGIHNAMHVRGLTGGRVSPTNDLVGHIADPSVAAFDPIFWFHHSNVDHLAATFQTLHPDLDPFHRDTTGIVWTADATRDWKARLRYDYDDLAAPGPSGAFAAFRTLAAGTTSRSPQTGGHSGLSDLRRRINGKYGTVRREVRASPDIRGRENDYMINIIYDRGASYSIHFFLGTPARRMGPLEHSDTYIGSMYTFSSILEGSRNGVQCHNCLEQKSKGVLSTAQIPLTRAILKLAKDPEKSDLRKMEPDEVDTYLETNLTWRATIAIEDHENPSRTTNVDMSCLPKTKIFAMKGRVQYPDRDSELSTYSDYTTMWRATSGKQGGAVRPDEQPTA
ncbi:common central domain of tyrosinase-domain-containing protein [Aspergillus cavernicola]|uniref:tyrosinase n=1 Tax=Aspergillus cavernicola TaxID=176166 RepID=A0ABR4I7K7_9EURO